MEIRGNTYRNYFFRLNLPGMRRIRGSLYTLGGLALFLGVCVYMADRTTGAHFLPENLMNPLGLNLHLHGSLPSLLHSIAMCALLVAAGASSIVGAGLICAMWIVISSTLELAQYEPIGSLFLANVPDWVLTLPVLENLPIYLLDSRYDPWDVGFSILGGLCAFATILGLYWRHRHEQ